MTFSTVDPAMIGERIKERRIGRGLSVNDLAHVSGVSRSMISEVERGGRTPTIVTLDRLAGALSTTSARMLAVEASGKIVLQRRGEHTVIGEDGWHRCVLNPVLPGIDFEFMRVEIEPHTDAGAYPPHGSGSREYIAVEAGELTLALDGDEQRLGAGDSIYFPGTLHHEFRNEADETCVYHLVMDMGSHEPHEVARVRGNLGGGEPTRTNGDEQ